MLVSQSHDKIALLWTWIGVELFKKMIILFEIIREMSFFSWLGIFFPTGTYSLWSKDISSFMAKHEMAKNIQLQMWNIFDFDMQKLLPFELTALAIWPIFDKDCRTLFKWQKYFHIKWQNLLTFANAYIFLPFQVLP